MKLSGLALIVLLLSAQHGQVSALPTYMPPPHPHCALVMACFVMSPNFQFNPDQSGFCNIIRAIQDCFGCTRGCNKFNSKQYQSILLQSDELVPILKTPCFIPIIDDAEDFNRQGNTQPRLLRDTPQLAGHNIDLRFTFQRLIMNSFVADLVFIDQSQRCDQSQYGLKLLTHKLLEAPLLRRWRRTRDQSMFQEEQGTAAEMVFERRIQIKIVQDELNENLPKLTPSESPQAFNPAEESDALGSLDLRKETSWTLFSIIVGRYFDEAKGSIYNEEKNYHSQVENLWKSIPTLQSAVLGKIAAENFCALSILSIGLVSRSTQLRTTTPRLPVAGLLGLTLGIAPVHASQQESTTTVEAKRPAKKEDDLNCEYLLTNWQTIAITAVLGGLALSLSSFSAVVLAGLLSKEDSVTVTLGWPPANIKKQVDVG